MRIAGVAISEVRGRHPGADEEWVAQLLASASVSTASGPSEADYVDDHGDSFNWTYVAVYGWRTDTSNPASKLSTTAAKPPAKKQRPNASAYFATTRHGAQPRVVRREWLKIFVSRKSAPKGAQRFIFSESPSAASSYAMQWKSATASVATCSTSATLARLVPRSRTPATLEHK